MKVVIQRVNQAKVSVDHDIKGQIDNGLLLLVGITHEDDTNDVDYMVKKIPNMRIFEDDDGKMNLSLIQKGYEILSISQFTLFADTKKGNRPGFSKSAKPDYANKLYNLFNDKLRKQGIKIDTGVFGASMEIDLINDGPVTIIIDSKNK